MSGKLRGETADAFGLSYNFPEIFSIESDCCIKLSSGVAGQNHCLSVVLNHNQLIISQLGPQSSLPQVLCGFVAFYLDFCPGRGILNLVINSLIKGDFITQNE